MVMGAPDAPIVTDVSPVQFKNDPLLVLLPPMVGAHGIDSVDKFVLFANAVFPMLVTVDGIAVIARCVQ